MVNDLLAASGQLDIHGLLPSWYPYLLQESNLQLCFATLAILIIAGTFSWKAQPNPDLGRTRYLSKAHGLFGGGHVAHRQIGA